MKKLILIGLLVAVVLSMAAFSKVSPLGKPMKKVEDITTTIKLEKEEICDTVFYDVREEVFDTCVHYDNHTKCLNTTGANTDCSENQDVVEYKCSQGFEVTKRSKTVCEPQKNIVVERTNKGVTTREKLDFSEWGACDSWKEGSCLMVECVALNDGAHNGKYVPCKPGMSCQRFEICDGSVKKTFRNSKNVFSEEDDSFFLPRLRMKEVVE